MEKIKYILLIFVFTLIIFMHIVYKNKKKKSLADKIGHHTLILFLIYFIVYFAFREISIVGTTIIGGKDAIVYKERFQNATGGIIHGITSQENEIGYALLVYLIRLFTDNFVVFQIIYYMIMIFMVFYIIGNYKFKANLITFILIFIYISIPFFDSANLMRNMLAYFIINCSIVCFINKKIKRSILLSIVASTIHISSIIFPFCFITYLLIKRKLNLRKIVFIPVLLFLAAYVCIEIVRPLFLGTRYAYYFVEENSSFPYGMLLERIGCIALYVFVGVKFNRKRRDINFVIFLLMFALLFLFLQQRVPIFYRINVMLSASCFYALAFLNNVIDTKSVLKSSFFTKSISVKKATLTLVVLLFLVFKVESLLNETIDSYGLLPHYYIVFDGLIGV